MTLLILYHKKTQESIHNEKLVGDFGYENGKNKGNLANQREGIGERGI